MNKLFTYVTQSTTLLTCTCVVAAVAATAAGSALAQAEAYPSAPMVQQALLEEMGDAAKDLTVTVNQGTVNLGGWAYGPREVHKARYLASKLPGVERAYSSLVRTWVSTDPTPVF